MIECIGLDLKRDLVLKIPKGAKILSVGNRDEQNGGLWYMYDKVPGPAPETYELHLMLLPDRAAAVTDFELMGRFVTRGCDSYFVFKVPEKEVKRRAQEELDKRKLA